MWFKHTTKFNPTVKNEIMSFARKWMELEINILSEISQIQTNNTCFLLQAEFRFKKRHEIEEELFGKRKGTNGGGRRTR
jgi:hypothetical protein